MIKTEEKDRAAKQARAQLDHIIELMKRYNNADDQEIDDIQEEIFYNALNVQVRSGWSNPGKDFIPEEYNILLCFGGPAVRIIGDLNEYKEPTTSKIEYQDWFTEWEELSISTEENEILTSYAIKFWFGE